MTEFEIMQTIMGLLGLFHIALMFRVWGACHTRRHSVINRVAMLMRAEW